MEGEKLNRRKAISSLIKSSLGGSTVLGSMGAINYGCQPEEGKKQRSKALIDAL